MLNDTVKTVVCMCSSRDRIVGNGLDLPHIIHTQMDTVCVAF